MKLLFNQITERQKEKKKKRKKKRKKKGHKTCNINPEQMKTE